MGKYKQINKEEVKNFHIKNKGFDVLITMNNGDKYSLRMSICLNNGLESGEITIEEFGKNRLGASISERWSVYKKLISKFQKSKTKENKNALLDKMIEIWNSNIKKHKNDLITIKTKELISEEKNRPEAKDIFEFMPEIKIGKTTLNKKQLRKLL